MSEIFNKKNVESTMAAATPSRNSITSGWHSEIIGDQYKKCQDEYLQLADRVIREGVERIRASKEKSEDYSTLFFQMLDLFADARKDFAMRKNWPQAEDFGVRRDKIFKAPTEVTNLAGRINGPFAEQTVNFAEEYFAFDPIIHTEFDSKDKSALKTVFIALTSLDLHSFHNLESRNADGKGPVWAWHVTHLEAKKKARWTYSEDLKFHLEHPSEKRERNDGSSSKIEEAKQDEPEAIGGVGRKNTINQLAPILEEQLRLGINKMNVTSMRDRSDRTDAVLSLLDEYFPTEEPAPPEPLPIDINSKLQIELLATNKQQMVSLAKTNRGLYSQLVLSRAVEITTAVDNHITRDRRDKFGTVTHGNLIAVKIKNGDEITTLSKLLFLFNKKDQVIISIVHPDSFYLGTIIKTVAKAFSKAISCNGEIKTLIPKVAYFSYLFFNAHPFYRGNASIGEWFIAAIFRSFEHQINFRSHVAMLAQTTPLQNFVESYSSMVGLENQKRQTLRAK